MRGAIIRPFQGVHIGERLRHHPIECHLKVEWHIGVGILIDREARRRVTEKEVQQADSEFSHFRNRLHDVTSDQMKAPRSGCQLNLLLNPHRTCSWPLGV